MRIGCSVVARCTCHIPYTLLRMHYRTMYHLFSMVICLVVNAVVHPSSNSCHMEISAPNWGWIGMCDDMALLDNKGLRFSSALWVYFMRIPYGKNTCGPCIV